MTNTQKHVFTVTLKRNAPFIFHLNYPSDILQCKIYAYNHQNIAKFCLHLCIIYKMSTCQKKLHFFIVSKIVLSACMKISISSSFLLVVCKTLFAKKSLDWNHPNSSMRSFIRRFNIQLKLKVNLIYNLIVVV